jgi:ATP-binding cassette subfamily B multidrug efflux pump
MKKLKELKPYLAGSYKLFWLALLFAFIAIGAKLAIPFLAGRAINGLVAGKVDFHVLTVYFVAMIALVVVGTIFRYAFDFLTALIGQNVVKRMRSIVYESYMEAPVSYLDQKEQGNLVQCLINDVENVQNGLVLGSTALFDGVVAIAFTLGFMFYINWALALIVVGLTPLSLIMSRLVSRHNSKYFKAQAADSGSLSGFTLESLNNREAVETLGLKKAREQDFDVLNKKFKGNNYQAAIGASIINPLTRLINYFINAIVITVGIIFIIKDVNIGVAFLVGDLSAFLTYAANYMQPFNEISDVVAEIDYAYASFKRIDAVAKAPRDTNSGTGVLSNTIDTLKAEDVNFSYDGKRQIIKDFSLDVYKGHRIALVGPTGCGKTTIINLLMRFYDPQTGAFYANSLSTQDLEKAAFRKHLGMVLQDTWIFKGTVYDNIAYAKPEATKEEVMQAATEAQASGFIARLPQGYDTIISDNSGLSTGEKQLICVARVMLLKPEIIILDEATSNIDLRTEALLNESFKTLMQGKTSFVVAHRLSTIRSSDLILVMKDGVIFEQGNHDELMAKKGFYYDLYTSQFAS